MISAEWREIARGLFPQRRWGTRAFDDRFAAAGLPRFPGGLLSRANGGSQGVNVKKYLAGGLVL